METKLEPPTREIEKVSKLGFLVVVSSRCFYSSSFSCIFLSSLVGFWSECLTL